MPYRLEKAKTARGGCTVKACKDADAKIAQGSMKFGTLVDIQDNQFYNWRHWGCVTPKVVENLKESLVDEEELNFDWLDGYEDMNDEDRARVRQALADGHVAEEDAIGTNHPDFAERKKAVQSHDKLINKLIKDIEKAEKKDDDAAKTKAERSLKAAQAEKDELNQWLEDRLKISNDIYGVGRWVSKAKLKQMEAENGENGDGDTAVPGKKKDLKGSKATTSKSDEEDASSAKKPTEKHARSRKAVEDESEVEADEPTPAPKRRKASKVKAENEKEQDDQPAPSSKRRKSTKVKTEDEDEDEDEEMRAADPKPAKRSRRTSKVKQEAPEGEEEDQEEESDVKPMPKPRKTSKAKVKAENEDEEEEAPARSKRGGRKRKN